jgi:GLPGLI family protein
MDDMDQDDKEWLEKFRAQMPKFTVHYFDMYFTHTTSVYKPGKEAENPVKMWFAQTPANDNVVYTDYTTQKVTANKIVYEEKFLVQDSMRKIKWKISDEIRTVANYKCRKAVGKMFDSVYVVAFYTDDIMVNGGPEMFSGLPGMILEVAIPRLYTTWIATKVDIAPPKPTDIAAPAKGKKVNQEGVYDAVKGTFKRWGKFAERNVWWTLI